MSHNRSLYGCSSVNTDQSQQFIKNAFDRLYERSPLPELLQSHLGNSPKKRFSGSDNTAPSERFNQIYASLKKKRKPDTSISNSDHSASFSHNNSLSNEVGRGYPHFNRSTDSVFKSPVQYWVDRSASRISNGNQRKVHVANSREDFAYDSENSEEGSDYRDLSYLNMNSGTNKAMSRGYDRRYNQENNRNSDQMEWNYQREDESTGRQTSDRLSGYEECPQQASPVIPMQNNHGHYTPRIQRSVTPVKRNLTPSRSKDSRTKEYVPPVYERAESDGSASDIDLIQSDNGEASPRVTDHNSVQESLDYTEDNGLHSVSHNGTDTEYKGTGTDTEKEDPVAAIDDEDIVDKLDGDENDMDIVDKLGGDEDDMDIVDKLGGDEDDMVKESVDGMDKKGSATGDDSDGETTPTAEDKTEAGKDTIEKESAVGTVDHKEERDLYEWIIKPVKTARGVCVEGKQSESVNEEFWKSSIIKERISNSKVQTASGTVYKLYGCIDKVYALEEGFSQKLVNAFKNGFPRNWKQLIADHFEESERDQQSEQDSKKEKAIHKKRDVKQTPKTGKQMATNENLETPVNHRPKNVENSGKIVCTPEGQFVDLTNLTKTRSGRMVKPPLFWWMGQGIVTDNNTVELSEVSSHAKNYIKDLANIYSSSTKKTKQPTSNLNRSYNTKKSKLNKSMNKTVGNVLDTDKSYEKVPASKINGSRGQKSFTRTKQVESSSKIGQNRKRDRRREGKTTTDNSENVTVENNSSERSDSENMDPVRNIEKVLQNSRSNRLKQKSQREKCYDDSDSMSRKDESQISDVYTISSDDEETKKSRVKRGSSKHQAKNTKKPGRKERYQSKSSSDEKERKRNEVGGQRNKEKMSKNIQDSEETNIRLTRSMLSTEASNSSLLHTKSTKVRRSRSQSQDEEEIRSRPQRKQSEQSRRSSQTESEDHHHSDSESDGDKRVKSSRKPRLTKRKNLTILDYSSSEEYVPKNRSGSRKRSNSKSKKSYSTTVDSDSEDFTQRTGTVVKNRKMSRLQDRQKNATKASNVWSSGEVKRLQQAVTSIQADHPDFWNLVQQKVITKTVDQCQEHHQKDIVGKTNKKDKSANNGVRNKVELTARQGTMKRRQQLRSLMEQHNEGHEDDLCDGTPFKNRIKSKVPHIGESSEDENEEELFNEVKRQNPNLANRFHTPVPHFHIEPVSQKKTPFNPLISPNEPVNRNEMDRYIHRVMKRRRLGANKQKNKDVHKTPVNKPPPRHEREDFPTPTKKLFDTTPGNVDSLLMAEEKADSDNHADSDENSDYYWTDMDQ